MRIRRKKHLDERVERVKDYLLIADYDVKNITEAIKIKDFFDFKKLFGNDNPVSLEIGCGKGLFITEMAKRHKDKNFFAIELIKNIAVSAAELAENNKLDNVRFFNCGAEYLPRYIKPKSIENIYLNFSPPFPQSRCENRRLTCLNNIVNYKEFLKEKGTLYQKTDDKEFFMYSFEMLSNNGFNVIDISDTIANDIDNVKTEYENKFLALGLQIYALKATLN